jgi:hypothetical protein
MQYKIQLQFKEIKVVIYSLQALKLFNKIIIKYKKIYLKISKKFIIVKILMFLLINKKAKKDLQANHVVLLINRMKNKMCIWTCINNKIQKIIKIQLIETTNKNSLKPVRFSYISNRITIHQNFQSYSMKK